MAVHRILGDGRVAALGVDADAVRRTCSTTTTARLSCGTHDAHGRPSRHERPPTRRAAAAREDARRIRHATITARMMPQTKDTTRAPEAPVPRRQVRPVHERRKPYILPAASRRSTRARARPRSGPKVATDDTVATIDSSDARTRLSPSRARSKAAKRAAATKPTFRTGTTPTMRGARRSHRQDQILISRVGRAGARRRSGSRRS